MINMDDTTTILVTIVILFVLLGCLYSILRLAIKRKFQKEGRRLILRGLRREKKDKNGTKK